MISVGSSDGRKGLSLGFGVGREMEETELEEGEACFHQNDENSTLDPDVTFSYIDEKLQHVLGHFQKDFEGGVSAENLGSKFGGYGSFLPTYQRSPAWSHPRTPPKVQNHNASPNMHLEGGRCNSVSSSASLSARLGSAPLSVASLAALRASSVDDCGKQEATLSSTHAENKPDNQSDQKTLKVRIKMGSDNLSTQKNAEIYSGLGLDVSPTSSFEDSPTDSEFSREPQDSPDESPTSILEIMTSFPVHGSPLLSPLHDDLICLTEKKKDLRESRSVPFAHRGGQESSLISLNGSDSARGDRKVFGEKRPKPSEKKASALELKNAQNGVDALFKKEADLDTLAGDELVSSALRLPLLSNSYCSVVDSAKDVTRAGDISRVANKGGVKEESFSDLAKDEPLGPVPSQENGWVEKPDEKAGSTGNIWEFKKANSDDDESRYPVKGDNLKGEKTDFPSKADSNVSKGRKGFNAELMDPAKHKTGQKATSYDDNDMKVSSGKEHPSSGSKRKSKGSQSHGTQIITEVLKDNMKTDTVTAPKSRKSAHVNTPVSNSEVEDIKKDTGKARDRYNDFFGDMELDLGDEEIVEEMPSSDRLNNYPVVEKSTCEFSSVSKERSNGKKFDHPSTSEACSRVASTVFPPAGNRPISDAAAPVAPLVKEDWVCCDKCQKWRLLPVGKNPESLPKMWLCSMLNWLDGMNRCAISEEETTKAVLSLHQIHAPGPAPEGQSSQNRYSGVTLSGLTSVDALHVDQIHQDIGGKKKHGFKDVLNATNQDGSSPFLNSKKKNPQASVKSRSLNGENQSSSLNEVDFQHSGQSSGLVGEKRRQKKKEKNKPFENYPGEGDTKSSKIRNKRETDQDFSKASKKVKTNAVHCTDEDWKSDSINETGKNRHKYDDLPKDSKRDSKVFVRNPEDQTQFTSDAGLLHAEKYIDRDTKKRKVNEYQDSQLYTTSLASGGHRLEEHRDYMEGTSESSHRKEKKARVSKSGGKESSISKGSGGIDKKVRSVKNQQSGADLGNNLSLRSLDAIDSVKRDMGSIQPSVAATSSSSKVSGSHKNKANLQEVKGSPVESVSSSPLRVFNQDKITSAGRNLGGNSDFQDTVSLATTSPRKCSDGEDGGGSDRTRMVRKDATITAINRGSVECAGHDFQDRDLAHISSRKAVAKPVHSPVFATHHVTDTLQGERYSCKPQISGQCHNDESGKGNQYHNNLSRRKSGKGSSSRSKDKNRGTRSESDKGNLKPSDFNESVDHSPCDGKSKARSMSQEKIARSEKVEKNIIDKKDPAGNFLTESGKRESRAKFGSQDGSDIRQVVVSNQDSKQNLLLDRNGERSSKRFPSDKTDRVDVSGKGKSHSLPPSGRGQNETTRWPQPIHGSYKENGVNMSVDASEGDDALKAPKQIKKAENQNGNQPVSSRHPINGHKVRDIDAPSPVRRDSSSQAATNAVKEAKDLKHLADRLKNSGSNLESTGLYFQAALKFLHGASLLESGNSENTKHGEMIQSMQMYSSTAKLCEFCAHEYEKSKDMASAALAYKCVEVAYLRVISSSHASASKDRHELQTALQIVPPGESPSSSASDVDNLNNPVTVDKVALAKGVSSPQVAGNHVIAARNRSNFVRLLNFAQDVNFAMEASRKSRIAFAAANSRVEETKYREGMPSVKKALDFNFQDVEGLLRLVRLAMEAISR